MPHANPSITINRIKSFWFKNLKFLQFSEKLYNLHYSNLYANGSQKAWIKIQHNETKVSELLCLVVSKALIIVNSWFSKNFSLSFLFCCCGTFWGDQNITYLAISKMIAPVSFITIHDLLRIQPFISSHPNHDFLIKFNLSICSSTNIKQWSLLNRCCLVPGWLILTLTKRCMLNARCCTELYMISYPLKEFLSRLWITFKEMYWMIEKWERMKQI